MKIFTRLEFMKLPPGTLYKKFTTPFAFEDLSVKFDSLPYHEDGDGDFVCMGIGDIEAGESGQMFERLDEMMEEGSSYPLELDYAGRDGMFEKEAMFLVFEHDDLVKLRAMIDKAIQESGE